MNDSSQSTILSRRDYIISERNNNRFRFSFGLCTQECVIQKIIEYLLQNQKSANSHQHLSMNTPHKCNHYYLCYLDIPRSVVTYTSNIFFLELSVLVTLQHIEIPFFNSPMPWRVLIPSFQILSSFFLLPISPFNSILP